MESGKDLIQYLAEAQARVVHLRDQLWELATASEAEETPESAQLRKELKAAEGNWSYVAASAEAAGIDPTPYRIDGVQRHPSDNKLDVLLERSQEESVGESRYTASFIAPARLRFSDRLSALKQGLPDVIVDIEEQNVPKLIRFEGQRLQIDLWLRGPEEQVNAWRLRIRELLSKHRLVQRVI